jgi:transcriptional regulator of met regulon
MKNNLNLSLSSTIGYYKKIKIKLIKIKKINNRIRIKILKIKTSNKTHTKMNILAKEFIKETN